MSGDYKKNGKNEKSIKFNKKAVLQPLKSRNIYDEQKKFQLHIFQRQLGGPISMIMRQGNKKTQQ